MKRSDIIPLPEYFDRYISQVADVDLSQAFTDSIEQLNQLSTNFLHDLDGRTPEVGKWTVKEIFQHLIDWERILSYRALLIARKENSSPQSIDENTLAANMNVERRTIEDLIEELKIVRLATKTMFAGFDGKTLLNTGINWKYEISALALGFTIIGHQTHHLKIIEEKYYPLLQEKSAV